MQVTRGMRRQSTKLARHRAILPVDALIAGVDPAKKESVVVFTRAADRGRLGKLTIPTDRTGVERLVARAAELRERVKRDLSLDYFVPHKAIVYIREHRLYR